MRQRMLESGRETVPVFTNDNSASILASLAAAKAAGVPGSFGGLTTRTKLVLGPALSGMTIRGALSGGRRLTGWARLTASDPAYSRIPVAARSQVWVCDLAANGVSSVGTPARRVNSQTVTAATIRLYEGDHPIPECRYPATGWLTSTVNPAPNQMSVQTTGMPVPAAWTGVRIDGFPVYDYRGESLPVTGYSAPTLTFGYTYSDEAATTYIWRTSRYALVGAPEWLTLGAWWADPSNLKVYYWHPAEPAGVWCDVFGDSLIEITGTGITLRDVSVRHSRKSGVVVNAAASGTRIERCRVSGVERGIEISSSTVVQDCEVHDFGLDGISVMPTGDRATLTPSGVEVLGNTIHRHIEPLTCAGIHAYASSGVGGKGVGYVVRNNRLMNLTGAGIIVAGNDHLVQDNILEDVSTDVDDFPGVYVSGRDYTCRGTVIERNVFRRIYNRIGTSAPVNAVFLDDGASGVKVLDNRFTDVQVALFLGGGRDNAFIGNVARVRPGGHLMKCDSRVASWSPWKEAADIGPPEGDWQVQTRLNLYSVTTGLWAFRYPELAAMTTAGNAHRLPNGNTMSGNAVWDGVKWVSDLSPLINRSPTDLEGATFQHQVIGVAGADIPN